MNINIDMVTIFLLTLIFYTDNDSLNQFDSPNRADGGLYAKAAIPITEVVDLRPISRIMKIEKSD